MCMVIYEYGTMKALYYRATEWAMLKEVDQQLYSNSFISDGNKLYLGGKENRIMVNKVISKWVT